MESLKTIGIISTFSLLAGGCNYEPEPAEKPNILVILADDMGYGDIRALNPGSAIPTPNLDRLAETGMVFTDAHSPSAVCTPTRYGLLTGRYSFRTRLKEGVLVGHSPSLVEPGRMTLGTLLQEEGYHTACIGKWHLGLDWPKKNNHEPLFTGNPWDIESTENVDYNGHVHGGPRDHGFDHSFILPASLDIQPYCYLENGEVVGTVDTRMEGKQGERGVFWRQGDATSEFRHKDVLPELTDKAIEYITEQSLNSTDPFFLYLPLTAPHTPWLPLEEFTGMSGAGRYGDFVVQVDHSVGRILEILEDLNVSDETLVIFTSDNGADWTEEDKAKYEHRANYVFRGMKSDVWEGGHRVPFLLRWPGVTKAEGTSKQLVCLTDMLHTFADLTGRELPFLAGEDSYSFLPVLKGETRNADLRDQLIMHSVDGTFAVRKSHWKLIPAPGSGGWSYSGSEGDPPVQLYKLDVDPGETANVYAAYPEMVDSLSALLEMVKFEQRSRYE